MWKFWLTLLLVLVSCVTIRENVIDCTDNGEYGIFLEVTFFKIDTIYYSDNWEYTVVRFSRFYVNESSAEVWVDTIISYIGKKKEL